MRNARSRSRVVAILHAKYKPREFQVFKPIFFFLSFFSLASRTVADKKGEKVTDSYLRAKVRNTDSIRVAYG